MHAVMVKTKRPLTFRLKERIIVVGAEVSPERLRTIVWMVAAKTATADEIAIRDHLAEDITDAYISRRNWSGLPQADFLRIFFAHGDASRAARQLNLPERTGRNWIQQFCKFAGAELHRRAERQRDIDAARAQCAESCGRRDRTRTSPDSAPRTRFTAQTLEKRRENMPHREGGRCPDCPLTALGV